MFRVTYIWWFVVFINSCHIAACQCPAVSQTDTNTGLEKFLISVLYRTLTGSYSEVNQMDPLFIESVQGNFATFQFSNINNTFTGLSKTEITSLKISPDYNMTAFKLDVPSFKVVAVTNVSGYTLYIPANGKNLYFEQEFGRFIMKVYAKLIQLTGSGDCKYLQFRDFSVESRELSPVSYNIASANKEENDKLIQLNQFRYDNWQDTAYFNEQSKGQPIVENLLNYANEYLRTTPINILL